MLVDRATLATRQKAVEAEIARCISEAKRLFNVDLKDMQVMYNLTGRTAGMASARRNYDGTIRYFIRLNRQMISGTQEAYNDMISDTISHEIAHIICYVRPELGRKHDTGWKNVHRKLGGNGKRCHDVDVAAMTGGFDYLTDAGHVITFSKNRHSKVQRGKMYRFKDGKGCVSKACPFIVRRPGQSKPTKEDFLAKGHSVPAKVNSYVMPQRVRFVGLGTAAEILKTLGLVDLVSPSKVPAPITRTVAPPPSKVVDNGMSKAQRVRLWISEAKRDNRNQTWVMEMAQMHLGMPKGQAYRYVTENWSKV